MTSHSDGVVTASEINALVVFQLKEHGLILPSFPGVQIPDHWRHTITEDEIQSACQRGNARKIRRHESFIIPAEKVGTPERIIETYEDGSALISHHEASDCDQYAAVAHSDVILWANKHRTWKQRPQPAAGIVYRTGHALNWFLNENRQLIFYDMMNRTEPSIYPPTPYPESHKKYVYRMWG